jgi:hypothetical protein
MKKIFLAAAVTFFPNRVSKVALTRELAHLDPNIFKLMNKQLLSFLFFVLCVLSTWLFPSQAQAQFARVEFDYANAYFNNGQPLPAEQRMIFTGTIDSSVKMVELAVFRAKAKQSKPPLFKGNWKRRSTNISTSFRIPVNYKFTGSSEYDFRFTYFRTVTDQEKDNLRRELSQSIQAYVIQALDKGNRKVKLTLSTRSMIEDLNSLAREGLRYYRSLNGIEFNGFSDLTQQAIENLDKTKNEAYPEAVRRVRSLINAEISQVFNSDLVVRSDERFVPQYETKRTRRPLALNVGYGGVLLELTEDNLSYDASPYVGFSLPLANPALAGRFWSNASVSLGVFTDNFTDLDGNVVTGPIFGRPYYLGVGYNLFRFIRINVGATAIERLGTSSAGGGNVRLDVDAISLMPFVGISAELEVWAGIREKQ